MGKFDFTAELGKIYSYNELNQRYGLNEETQDEDKFQENTIYFIEEEIKTVEFWDPTRKESLILKDFMNLYDFEKKRINQSNLKSFIETYGLPLYSEKRGDNEILQVNFSFQEMSKDSRFFYSKMDLKTLTSLILVLESILKLANTNNPESCEDRLSHMLYLLINPFLKQIAKEMLTISHIEEINCYIEMMEDELEKEREIISMVEKPIILPEYKAILRRRINECNAFKNAAGVNKHKPFEQKGDLSDNIFTDINYMNYNEILERADITLKFLCMIEGFHYSFTMDELGVFINNSKCSFSNKAIINNDLIEKITPLFVTDYLTCLIKMYTYEVVKDSKNYYLKMHLDTFGAILYGLIYTLDANRYMRKCPRCNKYFFPAPTHPNQRCCSHDCSDAYGKMLKRAEKKQNNCYSLYL